MSAVCVYTIGTWRVGLEAYLQQLSALKVRRVVDVRGNPRAGRQEELKRSKEFEKALWSVGISYEYWGREFGEDAVDSGSFKRVLTDLVSLVRRDTVCLLGHLHEPQGCHRLQVSDALADQGLMVKHLLWKDHREVRQMSHAEVASAAAEVLQFFNRNLESAERIRVARGNKSQLLDTQAVAWEDFDVAMFSDGRPHRFLLPFATELLWYPHWLSAEDADKLEHTIREEVTFYHPTYCFQEPNGGFTKTLIKRGQARICGDECPGAVSSQELQPWSRTLLESVEDAASESFNNFVANHYANGRVVINWHSDSGPGDDEGLGPNPRIGSLSLGAARNFSLKSKRQVGGRMIHLDIPLVHGSLLVMGKNSQTHWLHSLPADESCTKERINLTFRFYARQSTKHIEGVEHNHEWEAAEGSTRVLLHRDGYGRPIFVDLPDEIKAADLPRYLATVMPGFRGAAEILCHDRSGQWTPLSHDALVVSEMKAAGGAEVRVRRTAAGWAGKGTVSEGKGKTGAGRGNNGASKGKASNTEAGKGKTDAGKGYAGAGKGNAHESKGETGAAKGSTGRWRQKPQVEQDGHQSRRWSSKAKGG